MTDIEKKAWETYPNDNGFVPTLNQGFKREGYIKCAEEYESLPKIRGWVARDKNGSLNLHAFPPKRVYLGIWCCNPLDLNQDNIRLDDKILPEITWESEPVEVELLIRKI